MSSRTIEHQFLLHDSFQRSTSSCFECQIWPQFTASLCFMSDHFLKDYKTCTVFLYQTHTPLPLSSFQHNSNLSWSQSVWVEQHIVQYQCISLEKQPNPNSLMKKADAQYVQRILSVDKKSGNLKWEQAVMLKGKNKAWLLNFLTIIDIQCSVHTCVYNYTHEVKESITLYCMFLLYFALDKLESITKSATLNRCCMKSKPEHTSMPTNLLSVYLIISHDLCHPTKAWPGRR